MAFLSCVIELKINLFRIFFFWPFQTGLKFHIILSIHSMKKNTVFDILFLIITCTHSPTLAVEPISLGIAGLAGVSAFAGKECWERGVLWNFLYNIKQNSGIEKQFKLIF